jgi:hypothetical protein
MSLRSKLGMFVLTRQEQRTIAFVVLALVLGLLTRHYRNQQPVKSAAPNELQQTPIPPRSPTRENK